MICTKCKGEIVGKPFHVYYPLPKPKDLIDPEGHPYKTLQGTLDLCNDCAFLFKDEYNAK